MSYVAKCKKLVDKSGRDLALRSGRDDPRFRQQFRKTELCVFFQQGRCSKGTSCTFAHGQGDLNHVPDLTKTSLCKKWVVFSCRKASEACPFAHGPQELRTTEAYMALPRKEGQSDSSTDDEFSAPPPAMPAAPAPAVQVHSVPPQPPRLLPGEMCPVLALPVSAWVEVDPARSPYTADLASPVAASPFMANAWAYTIDPRPQCLGTTPAVPPTSSWPKPTAAEAPAGVWRLNGAPNEAQAQPPTFFAAPSSGGSTPTVSHSSQEDSTFSPPWASWGTGPSFDVVAQLCSNMESTKLVETLIKVMPEHYED